MLTASDEAYRRAVNRNAATGLYTGFGSVSLGSGSVGCAIDFDFPTTDPGLDEVGWELARLRRRNRRGEWGTPIPERRKR